MNNKMCKPEKISLRGGRLIDPASSTDRIMDVHMAEGRIVGLGDAPPDFVANKVMQIGGSWILPGLVDAAATIPVQTFNGCSEDDWLSFSAGGITSVVMASGGPEQVESATMAQRLKMRASTAGYVDWFPLGNLSVSRGGQFLSEMATLKEAGCVGFGDGIPHYLDHSILFKAFQYATDWNALLVIQCQDKDLAGEGIAHDGAIAALRGLRGIPEVAETVAVSRALLMAEFLETKIHLSHITSAKSLDLIRHAKSRGVAVTADVAIYQLFLKDDDIQDFDNNTYVIPPLRAESDRCALIKAVEEGLLCVASHHMPISQDAKTAPWEDTLPGISIAEYLLPLMHTAFSNLPPLQWLTYITNMPAKIFGISAGKIAIGSPADVIIFDPSLDRQVGDLWHSLGDNCPLKDSKVLGQVMVTYKCGREVYFDPKTHL